MLNMLPEQLETERLIVRVARPGDGQTFNHAVIESHERLAPWLAWVTPQPTVEASESSCRKAYARFLLNEDLMALFIERDSGALVGGGGLHNPNWKLRQFEIGYWGRTAYARSGLVTEGVRALAEHALVKLQASRVYLTTDDRNTASWRLAEKAGFQVEGILRNERLNLSGEFRSTRFYSRVEP
jgi:RimJ/RimL family protein N-acetyltransferase